MPKAPVKVRIETIVEEAPSHDGSPIFVAYQRQPVGYPIRPLWTHCIYDTTPKAADPRHIAYLARVIHDNTSLARENPYSTDRIEVIGMPMPNDATDEQRAMKSREHHMAEVAGRNAAKQKEWHIPGTFQHDSYLRNILVIFRFGQGWEQAIKRHPQDAWDSYAEPEIRRQDPYGAYLAVYWEKGDKIVLEEGDDPYPDMSVSVQRIVALDTSLSERQKKAEWFNQSYVAKGNLDEELGLE